LPRLELWELLGQLFSAGGSAFGLIYGATALSAMRLTLRGPIFTISPEASLGLAGLALTGLGSFAAIVVGQLRPPEGNVGALLLFWTDFAVLVLGDVVFYVLEPSATTVLMVGLLSAALTAVGLLVIVRRHARM